MPPLSAEALGALQGRLEIGDRPALAGKADGPLGALAWVATLIAARGGGLRSGMIVMTGSLIPTTAVGPGESARFAAGAPRLPAKSLSWLDRAHHEDASKEVATETWNNARPYRSSTSAMC